LRLLCTCPASQPCISALHLSPASPSQEAECGERAERISQLEAQLQAERTEAAQWQARAEAAEQQAAAASGALDGYDSEDDAWVDTDDPRVRPCVCARLLFSGLFSAKSSAIARRGQAVRLGAALHLDARPRARRLRYVADSTLDAKAAVSRELEERDDARRFAEQRKIAARDVHARVVNAD